MAASWRQGQIVAAFSTLGWTMLDVAYIALTVAFFALMIAYVRGCERLGREPTGEEERP